MSNVTTSTYMFNNCTSLVGAVPYDKTKTDATMANYTTGYFTEKAIQMLIKNTTLYGFADRIRVLSGTEETMTPAEMQSELDTFNTGMSAVVSEQDNLIAQIITALDGKTTPSTPDLNLKCSASFVGGADFKLTDINDNIIIPRTENDVENVDLSEYVGELVILYVYVSADISMEISDYGLSILLPEDNLMPYALLTRTYSFIVPNHDITLWFSEAT